MHWTRRTGAALALGLTALLAPAQSAPPPPAAPQQRFVVLLDAAHGGDDAGGPLAPGQPEKSFTLALTQRLKSLLAARGIQVVTTRDADASVDPARRAEIANHAVPAACLSLHASESGAGIHLFTSSLPPTPPSRFAAWKTAQSAFVTRSLALAGLVNSALQQSGMTVTLGGATLAGLDSMTCPAVAVEVAPERDAAQKITTQLDDPDYQARVSAALAAALVQWRADAGNTGVRQP